MHNGKDDNFALYFLDFVNDDVGIFDQFVRPGIEAWTPHIGQFRREEIFDPVKDSYDQFRRCALAIARYSGADTLDVINCVFVENDFHRPKRRRASVNDTYFGVFLARRRRTSASCSSVR